MTETPYFVGLHPRWLKWDQLFRIYVTRDRLCGAYLAGQIQDEKTAAIQLQSLFIFARRYVHRVLKRRADRESVYDQMNPSSKLFLDTDERNFHIQRLEVCRCTVSHKRRLWTPDNAGTVTLELRSGTQKQFILVGRQDPQIVAAMLKSFFPDTEEIEAATDMQGVSRGA